MDDLLAAIDDVQEKLTSQEYLRMMNALGDVHKVIEWFSERAAPTIVIRAPARATPAAAVGWPVAVRQALNRRLIGATEVSLSTLAHTELDRIVSDTHSTASRPRTQLLRNLKKLVENGEFRVREEDGERFYRGD